MEWAPAVAVHFRLHTRRNPETILMRNARFWALMAAFQLVFGLAIFGLTRQYYRAPPGRPVPEQANAGQTAASQATPEWPEPDAGSELEDLISAFPGQTASQDPVELSRQADQFFAKQQYDQAALLYEQALVAGSADVDDFNSLGLTLHYLGRSDEALAMLNEGIALDPSYQRIWLTLGFVNSQLGNAGPAREALTKAVQMDATSDVGQSAAEMLDQLP